MVFQVQEDTWLDYQDIEGTILCERGCPEETVSWTPKLVSSSGTVSHSEVDVDFQCILGLHSQIVDFTNAFAQSYIPSGGQVLI